MILLHEHALSLFEIYVNEILSIRRQLLYCRLTIKYIYTHLNICHMCRPAMTFFYDKIMLVLLEFADIHTINILAKKIILVL